jgi:hypothetical protein
MRKLFSCLSSILLEVLSIFAEMASGSMGLILADLFRLNLSKASTLGQFDSWTRLD